MPKQKTKKAISKRMKLTKNGKVLRRHSAMGHLLSSKSSKRRRRLRQCETIVGGQAKNMAEALRS